MITRGLIKRQTPVMGRLFSPKVVCVGDSIMQANVEITSVGGNTAEPSHAGQRGLLSQFQALTNHALKFRFQNWNGTVIGASNFAVSGYDTADMKNVLHSALKIQPDVIFANIGTNDLTSGSTSSTIIDNWRWMIDRCMERNVSVWINTIMPRNDSSGLEFTAQQEIYRLEANAALLAMSQEYAGRILVVNCDAFYLDPATGEAYTSMFIDGVHPNSYGAEVYATQGLIPALSQFYGIQKIKRSIPAAYNASTAPFGNLLTNPEFTGTGGTISGTGIGGVAPDNWTFTRTDGSSVTADGSIESKTNWNGDASNFVKAVITSTGAGVDNETIRWNPTSTVTSNVVAGQWYVCTVECLVDASTSGDNILRSVYAELRDNGTSGPVSRFFNVGYTSSGIKDYTPDGAKRYVLKTFPINSRTASGLVLRLNADIDGTLTGVRNVYFGEPVLQPIDFVSDDYNQDAQYVVATAGSTVFCRGGANNYLVLNPAGTLATLTITMPPLPQNNDIVWITSSEAVTALTLTSGKTVNGGVAALVANTPVAYMFNSTADEWFKIV